MDGDTKVQPLTPVGCTVNEIPFACESMVGLPYDGEPVDQLEHALQCAALLTEVSARTLKAQGGPMTEAEVAAFRSHPDWRLALRLREIDDQGKVPGAEVPGLEAYRPELAQVVSARQPAA